MSPSPRPLRAPALGLAALLGLSLASTGRAQTPPDAGRLLEQTRPAPQPTLPSTSAPRVVDVPVRPTITLPEGVTVRAESFRITGARSFPEAELAALLQPWVGRRLDLNGLNEAAGALTRHYQGRGHLLTYAYIPAQKVADGSIEVAVLEGRLDAVQIVSAQDLRLRDEVVQAHTDRLATRAEAPRPVLQGEVERQLLLLNDIPGVTARAAFTPGAATGSADMVVSVAEDEPLTMRVELDNHGGRSTGELRAGLALQFRDLFGWGDQTDARALVSRQGGLVSGSLSSSLPIGGDGYRIGASLSRLSYQLAGNFRSLGAVGNASTLGVDMSYPFIRSADTNLTLRLALESKRLRDEIQLIGSNHPKRNDLIEATLNYDRRDDWGGVSAVRASVSSGSLKMLDDLQRAQDAGGLFTARPYIKAGLQLVRQQALGGPFSLVMRAAAQAANGNLDSSEKMGLAGPGAVRAYAPGEASVDQGGLLSLEARYALDYLGGSLVLGLFHDRAEGRINRSPIVAGSNEPRLSGTGLSLRWNGADFGLSASMAWRGSRIPTAEGGDPSPRIYLQLSLTP